MSALQSQPLPPINGHNLFFNQPPPHVVSENGFPTLALAIIGITTAAFLLLSYYIFATRCCFRWQLVDPLGRFSIRWAQPDEDPLTSYSPSWQGRGLNELLIRDIPTFQFSKNGRELATGSSKCVVCLNEFRDRETLRVLPKCSHAFHLDCIDVWFLNNSNCPICRSAISGRDRYMPRPERMVAPNSSPQDPHPADWVDREFVEIVIISGGDEASEPTTNGDSGRFLVRPRSQSSRKLETRIRKPSKQPRFMGDEGIHVGETDDDRFCVQPIRRSFSMDSADDRHVYLSVQEIIRQGRGGSRNAVLPIE
ncbi:hypothetical protein OROMI_015914 [Orobanche minor]